MSLRSLVYIATSHRWWKLRKAIFFSFIEHLNALLLLLYFGEAVNERDYL